MLKALKKLISKPEEPAPKAADTTPRQAAAPTPAPQQNDSANRERKPRTRDRKRPAKPPAAPVKPWSINDFQFHRPKVKPASTTSRCLTA